MKKHPIRSALRLTGHILAVSLAVGAAFVLLGWLSVHLAIQMGIDTIEEVQAMGVAIRDLEPSLTALRLTSYAALLWHWPAFIHWVGRRKKAPPEVIGLIAGDRWRPARLMLYSESAIWLIWYIRQGVH